jgi:hypothetical protein
MGAVSHRALIRRLVNGATNPPSVGPRRCEGTVILDAHWTDRRDENGKKVRKSNGGPYDYERVWIEEEERPCGMGCSVWVPELSYCAHHLPIDLLTLVARRAELWALLCADVWTDVCAEYPIPDEWDGSRILEQADGR